MTYSLADLNQMSESAFVEALGAIFEDTPAIAAAAWHQRPFQSIDALHQCMVAIVEAMSPEAQLALIQAHPDLGSRLAMAPASAQEQAGVGLDRLTPEEYDRFSELNQAYKSKFGFPFIIAVRNHTKASILAAFSQRLNHLPATEHQQALNEIYQIARFRLGDIVH
ncbi:MAG: 2-oxo-4-hydroxy-4-carboxy-5-ureidoimidazoline decarboxylase [Cyanobacteria bacterium]|nr:2-oxo-4-hydroxy-4-carboxy-5-ureidoimidazoline decarboxylase [Cyanobacteriota bacterium]MDW8202878.1 2-oxo-4-hydroxy-4-carboxy-5-ureidoimidazoline decarboxylase [Cyanobacteriota bacterium SKYGB_h_bin112]